MNHIKGIRFGYPIIQRISLIRDRGVRHVGWNSHNGCEIHYVFKGQFGWKLAGREDELHLQGGQFTIIPPDTQHQAINEVGTPSERIGVIFASSRLAGDSFSTIPESDFTHIFARLTSAAGTIHPLSHGMKADLRRVRESIENFKPDSADAILALRLHCESLLFETYAALSACTVVERDEQVIPRICEWIDAHLSERHSIKSLTDRSGYGRSQFFTLFHDHTGLTPADYIVRKRIELAKLLIVKDPEAKLCDIAKRCGFNSAINFSTVFRRFTGSSPSNFTKKMLQST